LAALTKAFASATVLIIGAMIPSAPKSSARLAVANAPSGTRTTGCGADRADRGDGNRGRCGIPQAVLLVDGDGDETFSRDGLGDDRRRQRAPASVNGLAGGKTASEGVACEIGHQPDSIGKIDAAVRRIASPPERWLLLTFLDLVDG
jgi:hypothetical protein